MIEKKTMGYVDFDYPQCDAKAVTVMADTETGQVEARRSTDDEDDDWYTPRMSDHYYPTIDEAQKALEDHRKELRELMPKVRNWVEQMDHLSYGLEKMPEKADEDEWRKTHPDFFTREDYLPYQYARKNDTTWKDRKISRLEKMNRMLTDVAVTGFLNIRGDQFRIDDVEHVRWGEECAELILKNGLAVKTAGDYDYNVVCALFGSNVSTYTYTRLKKEE